MTDNKQEKDYIVTYDISFKVTTATSIIVSAEDAEAAKVKALAVPKGLLMSNLKQQLADNKHSEVGREFLDMLDKAAENANEVEISASDIIQSS